MKIKNCLLFLDESKESEEASKLLRKLKEISITRIKLKWFEEKDERDVWPYLFVYISPQIVPKEFKGLKEIKKFIELYRKGKDEAVLKAKKYDCWIWYYKRSKKITIP